MWNFWLVSAQGFEPRTHALEGRCSIQLSYAPTLYYLERQTRFELATSTLARLRSTTELFPQILATWKGLEPSTSSVTGWHSNQLNYQAANGGTNRARTCDPLLVRQVLSQLSYGPILVTHRGIEPLLPPWKGGVLTAWPMSHIILF